MPTDKKRINLTVPDDLYEKIQEYKKKAFVNSDATACLQLIAKQFESMDNSKQIINALKNLSDEDIRNLVDEGIEDVRSFPEEENATK